MSFTRYSFQTMAVRCIVFFMGIFISIINARWLGPEGVGVLSLLILIQSLAFRFGNLGFGSALAYFIARKEVSVVSLQKIAWLVTLVMSFITCTLVVLVQKSWFSPWKGINLSLFYLSLAAVPPFFLKNMLCRILSGQLRISVVNVSEIIQPIVMLLMLCFLVVLADMQIRGAVIAMLCSQGVGLVYLIYKVRNSKINNEEKQGLVSVKLIAQLWRYGRWNYLVMLANFFLEQLPLLMLPHFSTKSGVGFFAQARNLSMRTRMIAEPFSKMLFPFTAASEEKDAVSRTNILCRSFSIIMICICICSVIFIKPLILLLYGKAFLRTVTLFYALVPGMLSWPISQFLGVHIAASGFPKLVFVTSLCSVICAGILSSFLIPAYGDFGAVLSVSAIFVILACLRIGMYKKLTGSLVRDVIFPKWSDRVYLIGFYSAAKKLCHFV